jgi:hypothetical protein
VAESFDSSSFVSFEKHVVPGRLEDVQLLRIPMNSLSSTLSGVCVAFSLLLGACTEPSEPPANDTEKNDVLQSDVVEDVSLEEDTDGTGPDVEQDALADDAAAILSCDPPLALGPSAAIVPVYGYLQMTASGGTGQYRFSLKEDVSGAVVNFLTGAYLAGGIGEVSDRVILEDLGCVGDASLDVKVVDDPVLKPLQSAIPPKACLQFDVQNGSGEFEFEIVSGTPMGTIDASGLYVAGEVSGSDVIRVRDKKTLQSNDATVVIDPNSTLKPYPTRLFIPLGSTHKVPVVGGSADYELSSSGSAVASDGDDLYAAEIGTATVTVTDRNVYCVGTGASTYLETELEVTTVASLDLPGTSHNSGGWANIVGPGDLDGDGIPDAVVGHDRSNVGGFRSGIVTVFKGTPEGLEKTPSWIGLPEQRLAYYGRFFLVEDLNGDGEKDLLVGSSEDYLAGVRMGAVYLYLGVKNGFFEEAPQRVWTGTETYEHFGSAVSTCDFDGDGFQDLAVSAVLAEDEGADEVFNDQGAVFIFRGSEDGIEDVASQEIFGVKSDPDKGWVGLKSLYFGQTIASGDYNGDGFCDLSVGIRSYAYGGKGNAGAILLYRGGSDGLSELPVRAWAGIEEGDKESLLGYCLKMADVDQDGLSDIVACQRDHLSEKGNNVGAVRIFRGDSELGEEAADGLLSVEVADWTVSADQGSDRLGYWVDIADMTGDGIVDIIAGAGADEAVAYPGNTGTINLYKGQEGGLPALEPYQRIPGESSGDTFGATMGAIGDLNGDGLSELVGLALFPDYEGTNVPRVYMSWGRGEAAIPWGDTWSFFDDGTEPSADWIENDYDDSSWATGAAELGFGEEDETTTVNPEATTVYFRKEITVTDPVSFYEFIVRYDDGFALWVNGELVHTEKIGEEEDAFLYESPATAQSDNALVRFSLGEEGTNPFVEGANVVSVMVKQAANAGGDLSFDMELSLYAGAEPGEGSLELLGMPNAISFDQNGRSVAIVDDMTNDGVQDILVGSPGSADEGKNPEFGRVHIYKGTGTGLDHEFFKSMKGFMQTANGIEVGYVVGSAGDVDGDGKNDFAFHARETTQPNSFDPEFYLAPPACQTKRSSVGATYVFLGGPGSGYTSTEPAFIFYGPEVNRDPEKMVGGFDIDGDGYDDIAMASRTFRGEQNLNNAGGVAFYRGTFDTPGKVTVGCEPYAFFTGSKANNQMGRGMAPLGKLDDDECDEFAVGTDLEDFNGQNDQGSVRVIYGWGPKCNSNYPRIVTLIPESSSARSGWAIDGGEDIDGDGLPDLLVGAPDFRQDGNRIGAAYVIRGSYIASLEPDVTITGDLPQTPTLYPFTPPAEEPLMVRGTLLTNSGYDMAWFGSSVKFVPGLKGGKPGIAVGAFHGAGPGPLLVGDVRVWSFEDNDHFELMAAVGGETPRTRSRFGEFFDAGLIKGKPTLVIGAWYGTPYGVTDRLDNGSVYVIPLK